ncbi:MAG: peptidase T [Lachnospiraceae bacterium]|jgi:tripeptide aminopeptidase|nr:peptidase T [Lachnospiraceae bacterium]
MTKTIENFLQYVKIDTQSDASTKTSPSTAKQHDLARLLAEQLEAMGAEEITYDERHCYVYASIPASSGCENAPVLGYIAHMDTSDAVSGANVKPRIVKNYDGGDIILNQEKNILFRTKDFPEIKRHIGKDLIVTDGTTLLGGDDKAGVAEIMAACEYLLGHPEIRHGKLRVGFTPDEEIGEGTEHFDVKLFGADFAYTVDGGDFGGMEIENFNAAGAKVHISGRSTHPGSAKGKMINSMLIAFELQSLLPAFQNPMYTEGYEGFFHLAGITGDVENTTAEYIIRDHDRELFGQKKQLLAQCRDFLNAKYGEGTVEIDMEDSYYNMKELLEPHGHLIQNVRELVEEMGGKLQLEPIRGGTDGARLSYMGLPCPNLGTGCSNGHSRFEYACIQSMEQVTELLVRLAQRYGNGV